MAPVGLAIELNLNPHSLHTTEMQRMVTGFRLYNRENDFLFRDTLIKLVLSSNLEYENLTARVQDAG